MKRHLFLILFFCSSLASAAQQVAGPRSGQHYTESPLSGSFPVYSVPQLIALSDDEWAHRHHTIKGEFSFPIKRAANGVGRDADHFYLDSEADFRSPTSLNVVLLPHAAAQLKDKLGADAVDKLLGTTLTVRGLARHVKLICRDGGCPQDPKATHYFQTQVWVNDISQIVSENIAGK